MRFYSALGAICLMLACEGGASSSASPDATVTDVAHGDTAGVDVGDKDTEQVEPEPVAPSPSLEHALTGTENDALFPAADGDVVVWVTPKLNAQTGAAEVPAGRARITIDNCLTCPSCGYCLWQLHVGTGTLANERVFAEEPYLQSPPRVGDGLVTWMHSDGTIGVYTVATGGLTSLTLNEGWPGSTPVPKDGAIWWYGYSYQTNRYGLLRRGLTDPSGSVVVEAQMQESWMVPNGSFSGIARWQPFSFGPDGDVIWAEWGGTNVVIKRWRSGLAAAQVAVAEPGRDYLTAAAGPDGVVITKGYDHQLGCGEQACDLTVEVHDGHITRELTAGGSPTLYGRPIVSGNRVYWLDYRDGPYAVWARDLMDKDAAPERITSEDAVIGVTSPVSVTATRMIWPDRRDGVWRIYSKAL